MKRELIHNGRTLEFSVDERENGTSVSVNGVSLTVRVQESASGRLVIAGEGRSSRARVAREKDRIHVWLDGRTYEFVAPSADGGGAPGEEFSRNEVHAPMPGTVIKLPIEVGDAVEEGQTVVVVEAMKMEHNLRAPRSGVVAKINAQVGRIVDTETALIVLAEGD